MILFLQHSVKNLYILNNDMIIFKLQVVSPSYIQVQFKHNKNMFIVVPIFH